MSKLRIAAYCSALVLFALVSYSPIECFSQVSSQRASQAKSSARSTIPSDSARPAAAANAQPPAHPMQKAGSKTSAAEHAPEVALTFDDLPVHGPLPNGVTREDIANSIIHALQAAHIPPTYGFVNAKRIQEDPSTEQVLQLWRNAGFPLGNHTFSHMDPNTNTTEAFEKDLEADEPTLKKYMDGQDYRWLRFPFLHEGANPAQHKEIEDYLKKREYKVAEVTLSFGDYLYNEPYARCVAKNDTQAIDWMKKSYLDGSIADLEHAEEVSNLIYGRDIKHVMLLHIGGFDAIMIPSLIDTLKQHGVKLISLQNAESDPAYTTSAQLPGVWQGTFLEQMMVERHITPPPGGGENVGAKLAALCR